VVAADVNDAGGEETVASIHAAAGDALYVHADVGQMDDVRELVAAAVRRYGTIHVLHSNAAAYALGSATEIDEAAWDRTIAVCLKAAWMLAHHAVPIMLAQGGGAVVITGSNHAIRGYKGHAAYQAAKGGLLALTRALASDYAPTIRVNAILPGAIETGLWAGISASEREEIAQNCPLRRNGQPEDIAQAALFLASEMSSYMTGTYLLVDGGLSSHVRVPGEA
jgi:NAD(P)-dependent dehydrogenase (short-subunit alcohol dehydrogenase family)